MNAAIENDRPDLEILRQLLASATHDASAAMSHWTDGLITLTLDEVRECSGTLGSPGAEDRQSTGPKDTAEEVDVALATEGALP
jgi:hypothetical protein